MLAWKWPYLIKVLLEEDAFEGCAHSLCFAHVVIRMWCYLAHFWMAAH